MTQRVLLIDDEPTLLDILSFFLEDAGYQVLTAEDGEAAMKVLQTHQPDAIVCDLHMPGMNGLEFCQIVRQHPEWQSVFFTLLTGETEGIGFEKQPGLRIDEYLAKAFELDDLLAILETNHRPKKKT